MLLGCQSEDEDKTDTGDVSIPTVRSEAICDIPDGELVEVTDLIDGDTIEVRVSSGGVERVRYIGMNTPEKYEDCFGEATRYNEQLVDTKDVELFQDVSNRDQYGRLLRYVCTQDDIFVNGQLVAAGLAEAVRYPPDTLHASYLEDIEADAVSAGRGCLHEVTDGGSGGEDGGGGCCRTCTTGKACGDSCIRYD